MKNFGAGIAVVNVLNPSKKIAMNKDLNGGFGTADSYGQSMPERIISIAKKKSIRLPIVSLASLMGIFKQKGIPAKYSELSEPNLPEKRDLILVYGSIVDFRNECRMARELKLQHPGSQIGFIGPFPSTMPELYTASCDFVIKGDFEKFFLNRFMPGSRLNGIINVEGNVNLDHLPPPELDGFPIKSYGYAPAIKERPFFALQASKGCPYICSYYCVYGKFQGPKVNVRSPEKVVGDMAYLNSKYGIRGFQFRDPTFGIQKGYVEKFCEELEKSGLKVKWGIETRVDLLDRQKIKFMFDKGLRNINLGIETTNENVAKRNKRLLANIEKQEEIIRFCEGLGVKVSAFYMLGYADDTIDSMASTLAYAKRLNTFLARFAVSTPYPGTQFFEDLKKQGRILTFDYEKYTQFNPIIKYSNLEPADIRMMLSRAFREYYFRPKYLLNLFEWKARDLWL